MILPKSGWRDAKSGPKRARKRLVILKSGFKRDVQDGRVRGQQQPCSTIQSEPSLVCPRCFAEHLHHQSMKLPVGKASGARHRVHATRTFRQTESPAQTPGGIAIPESRAGFKHLSTLQARICACLDLFCLWGTFPTSQFLIPPSYFPPAVLIFPAILQNPSPTRI